MESKWKITLLFLKFSRPLWLINTLHFPINKIFPKRYRPKFYRMTWILFLCQHKTNKYFSTLRIMFKLNHSRFNNLSWFQWHWCPFNKSSINIKSFTVNPYIRNSPLLFNNTYGQLIKLSSPTLSIRFKVKFLTPILIINEEISLWGMSKISQISLAAHNKI